MPLCIVHISGPPNSGKTRLAQLIAHELANDPPHHLRMIRTATSEERFTSLVSVMDGMHESRTCTFSPDRIFEHLPAALGAIKRQRRWATVLLETDTDPCHRHAHEYQVRAFIAPAPHSPGEVFRSAEDAARAMNSIMQDTLAFAQEIFGLCPDPMLDESRAGMSALQAATQSPLRDPMSETEMGRLLASHIGRDIATRIALQPNFHPIIDSDVVVINTARGSTGPVVDDVARRIERLQGRIERPPSRKPILAVCDMDDESDPMVRATVKRMASLIQQAKARWP